MATFQRAHSGPNNITIMNGSATSDSFDLSQWSGGSIQFPDTVDGVSMTYEVSNDGTNYAAAMDSAGIALQAIPIDADVVIPLKPALFMSKHARIVTNINQTAERTIKLFVKG